MIENMLEHSLIHPDSVYTAISMRRTDPGYLGAILDEVAAVEKETQTRGDQASSLNYKLAARMLQLSDIANIRSKA